MAFNPRDARGRFRSNAPSTSRNPPGGFPDIQPIPHTAGPPSDHEVQGLLTDTGIQDMTNVIDSPVHQSPRQEVTTLSQGSPHETLPHLELAPMRQPSADSIRATSTPQPLPILLSRPLSPSRLLTPTYSVAAPPLTRFAPPPGAPPPPVFVPWPPAPALPPAPAGIDPVIWANNQALILNLLPVLQVLQPAPAPHLPKEGDVKAPTTFSGDDPTKLREFLFKCGLIFETKHRTYATEKSRVLYAIQHLDGVAKHHFRRYIETGSTDAKVNQWGAFVRELEEVFGNTDRIGRASDKILSLKMKETSRVHRFTVAFKEAADELSWTDDVLHHLYYNGLPNRIKDLWAKSDPPAGFNDLI